LKAARAIAARLARRFPSIDGICVYGSVARGQATVWSDMDLLVVGSNARLSPARLKKALPAAEREFVSIIFYPTSVFRRQRAERALFIAHIRNEAKILFDREDLLRETLTKPFEPRVDVEEGVAAHLMRLAPYDDPRRFGGNFLFCFAHLYAIGKGVVMLGLAAAGTLEFDRERAFRRFRRLHPDLGPEIDTVTTLRPFYSLVTSRQPEPLPFPYHGAERDARRAVAAIRTLARRVRGR
jgi:predicted nucleotidyltransferase